MQAVMRSLGLQLGFVLLVLFVTFPAGVGMIDGDVCALVGFAPFTITSMFGAWEVGGLSGDDRTNYGFSHLAAALMAIDHFNARNTSVVPELANFGSCNITLQLANFFDTGTLTQYASQQLFDLFVEGGKEAARCAIVGPFNDYPAVELSVMAQAARIPMVAHRTYSSRLTHNFFSRYTSSVYPDGEASANSMVSMLQHKNRTNYIGFLYSITETNYQRREYLTFELDQQGMKWMSSAYVNPLAPPSNHGNGEESSRTTYAALGRIKASGYRTIVVALESFAELTALADAAEELDMNGGGHFWVWFDTFIFENVLGDTTGLNLNISKLVHGSAWIVPVSDAYAIHPETNFSLAWKSQGSKEIDLLNNQNPIESGGVGYRFAGDDFFSDVSIEYGSGFMYDSVMSIGIGACLAKQSEETVSGINHVTGIRQTNVTGATGRIAFGAENGDWQRGGTRLASTVSWGVFNILWQPQETGSENPPNSSGLSENGKLSYVLTDVLLADRPSREWTVNEEFIYRDGRVVPPDLLRDEASKNYLSDSLRIAGLSMMAVVMAAAVVFAAWVWFCWNHPVLRKSQPAFLLCICFGSIVQASAVFIHSFDENSGWDEHQLSAACMAGPWLISVGHVIVYASLASKLVRIHNVLSFSRRRVKVHRYVMPMALLLCLSMLLLLLWTVIAPLEWSRHTIDDETGESIGHCQSDHILAFAIPLVSVLVIPVFATGIFAYKTRDVDEAYSESRWIMTLFLVQLEVVLFAVPLMVILSDQSTAARYIGISLMVLTFPASTLALILFPKVVAYRNAVLGLDSRNKPKRGERVATRVTGIDMPVPSDVARLSSGLSQNPVRFSSGLSSNPAQRKSVPAGPVVTTGMTAVTETSNH